VDPGREFTQRGGGIVEDNSHVRFLVGRIRVRITSAAGLGTEVDCPAAVRG
jgi:hypothetical protein